jgi:hypothetical protein
MKTASRYESILCSDIQNSRFWNASFFEAMERPEDRLTLFLWITGYKQFGKKNFTYSQCKKVLERKLWLVRKSMLYMKPFYERVFCTGNIKKITVPMIFPL